MTRPLQGTSPVPGRRRAALAGIGLAAATVVSGCGGPAGAGSVTPPPSSVQAGPSAEAPVEEPVGSVHPVTTVVITDDPAVAAAGPRAERTWVGSLAERLEDAASPLALTSVAVESAGFVPADSRDGISFTDLVLERVVHDTQLVIFFQTDMSGNDPARVGDAALEAFNAVEERAPDAYVVVVGPHRFLPDAAEPSTGVQQAVRDAADRAVVVVEHIDPVAEGWPEGVPAPQFADLLLPHLADLVRALSQSGAFD